MASHMAQDLDICHISCMRHPSLVVPGPHAIDPQATLQVLCNVTWNVPTCDLPHHTLHHDMLIVLHVPDWSCMSHGM